MAIIKGSGRATAIIFLLLLTLVMVLPAQAENPGLSDTALEGISAQGISVGGDSTTSCSTGNGSVCLGSYEWNDNHQFDGSSYKGSIHMDGNVQQNVSGEINLNQTESAGATGVTVIGNNSLNNSTLSITNSNNATNFVGGF
jgi:hypothetical protein